MKMLQVTLFVALLGFLASAATGSKDFLPIDCNDIYSNDNTSPSGVYSIFPGGPTTPLQVFCDMTTDGGRRTRMDGTESFNRPWSHYQAGFGNLAGEYWLDYVTSFSILVSNSVSKSPNHTYSTCVPQGGILLGGMRRLQKTNKDFNFTYTEDPNYGPFLQGVNGLNGSRKDSTYWELLVNNTTTTTDLTSGIGCYIPSENDQIILNFKKY